MPLDELNASDRHPAAIQQATAGFASELNGTFTQCFGDSAALCEVRIQNTCQPISADWALEIRIHVSPSANFAIYVQQSESMIAIGDGRPLFQHRFLLSRPEGLPLITVVEVAHW